MKKNKRNHSLSMQAFTLLLTVLLLFASLPLAAIAEDGLPQEEGGAPQIYDNAASAETAEGEVLEVESLREANVKHFYMGDGTYRAVSYGTEVHRKDAEGVWQEIDNTLTLQNGYHTTPDGRVKLASGSAASGYLLQLAENGYGIDMAMLPPSEPAGDMSMDMNANATLHTGSVTIQNAQREAVLETDSAEVKYQKLSKTLNHSKLTYANLSAGLDVSYELSGNKITEKIVVKGARDSYDFAFRLNLTGLTAALDENDTITFADAETGEAVYRMSLPYVRLGERGAQLAAEYTLEQVQEGDYLLLISADAAVENLFASVEPKAENSIMAEVNVNYVTITTTVEQLPREFETGEYAYISESSPTTSYTDVEMISVGGGDIGYIYVPLPSNLEFASINSAYLSLYCEVEERFDLRIHRCTAQWHTLGNFVYNYALNAWTNFGLDSNNYLDFAIGTKETVSFDVTELVSDWQFGDAPNYGFGLAGVEEELSMWFYRDGDDAEPVLTVTYQYVDVSIPDVTYYLQNVMYESFMQVAGNGAVVSSDFVGTDAQWKFEKIENGFYKIMSVANNKLLTADSNTIGSGVSLQPNTNTPTLYQQWKILMRGNYVVLCPRSSYLITGSPTYERCIGAAPNLGTNNTRGVNVYSNLGTHSSDEGWMIHSTNDLHYATVEVYFDHAYVSRYGGSSTNVNDRINVVRSRLNRHMTMLHDVFLERFSIYVNYTIKSNYMECVACAASCYSNHYNDVCDCYGEFSCNLHHTNMNNIHEELVNTYGWSQTNDNIVRIFFIGHSGCYMIQPNANVPPAHMAEWMPALGVQAVGEGVIAIHAYNDTDLVYNSENATYEWQTVDVDEPFERGVLMHEFGHVFSAPDHYGSGRPTTDEMNNPLFNSYCRYGERKGEDHVENNYIICEGCRQTILANADIFG